MKRSARQGIRKARRAFRRRNFTRVINFLEPQVFLYRDSYDYYYLLGMSCLYTNDYSGAYSYLRRALDIDEQPGAMLGLAAVQLRRRQIQAALQTYLDILDVDDRNRRARRALQWLRNLDHPEAAIDWFEDRRVRRILPPIGWFVPRWIAVPAVLAIIAGTAVLAAPMVAQVLRAAGDRRPGTEFVIPEHSDTDLVTPPDEERFVLTDREAERLLADIGRAFNDRRDNLVRRELNRIRLSNARPSIRERAELIREYLETPDFSSFQDNYSWDEVADDPALHAGVYVRWKGRVANLAIGEEAITFDFLAGYHTRRVLDGIVPAVLRFSVLLENDQAVELIGQVVPDPAVDAGFSLAVGSIRRLAPAELSAENE